MSSLNNALKQFEIAEANLLKAEKTWRNITQMIPEGVSIGDMTNGVYDDLRRSFNDICQELPKIDGWQMPVQIYSLDEIGYSRLDALDCDFFDGRAQL